MNKLKLGSIIASAAFLGSGFLFSASADWNFEVSHNGRGSENEIEFDYDNTISISQENNSEFNNDVNLDLNTGNNSISGNTGGDVSLETGNIDANVEISNVGGFNFAKVNSCNDCQGDFDLTIEGNGRDSENRIDVDYDNSVNVDQENNTEFNNNVDIDANTGDNDIEGSTGNHHGYFDKHDKDYDHVKDKGYDKDHNYGYNHDKDWDKDHEYFGKHYPKHDWDKDYDKVKFVKHNPYSDGKGYVHDSKYHDWDDHDWYFDKDHGKYVSKYYDWCKDHEFDYDLWKKYHEYFPWEYGHGGGDVSIETGDVDANVSISNVGGYNTVH